MHVLSTSLNNNSLKIVDKIMQSDYLCVILYFTHKKIPFLGVLT